MLRGKHGMPDMCRTRAVVAVPFDAAAAVIVVVAQKLLALQRRCGNFDMGPRQPQWDNETVGQATGRQMRQCDTVKICFAFKSNKK